MSRSAGNSDSRNSQSAYTNIPSHPTNIQYDTMKTHLVTAFLLFCYVHAEFSLKRNCDNRQFECDNGRCIHKSVWCSFTHHHYIRNECGDNSDILSCSQTNYSCSTNHSHCLDNGRCIPLKWFCDGYKDCPDGSDETECLNGGFRIKDISSVIQAKSLAKEWMIQQRRPNWGWEQDSARAILALYLSENKQSESNDHNWILMLKQLQIQLSESLLRNDNVTLPIHKLAHYIHSLLAMCQDPRNFLSKNLVEELQKLSQNSKSVNPFVTLVLCNSNYTLPSSSIKGLIEIILKPSKPEIIGLKAYAAMTFNCLRRRNLVHLESIYRNFLINQTVTTEHRNITKGEDLFMNLQKEDGSFGNVHTTAVVIQALLSTGNYDNNSWDLSKAYRYLLQQQKLDGSFGDMMHTYLVLPLLNQRTLVDLGNVSCSLEHANLRNLTVKEEFESRQTQKQRVTYSIWLGEKVDISFMMTMNLPINITFYDAMRLAAELDSKYSFQHVTYRKGKYVHSIFDTSNDPEARTYWKLFRADGDQIHFAGDYPDKVIPKNGEKFIYWYKYY